MKRMICALLTLAMLLTLAIPVFAEGESVVKSIAVSGITAPASGNTIPSDAASGAKVKVLALLEGKEEPEEISASVSGFWAETSAPDTALTEGSFVTGKKYRVCVTVTLSDATAEIRDGETEFSINGTKVSASVDGGKATMSADFVASPGDFSPKGVTLEYEGSKFKSYDGKATVLKVSCEKMEGVEYRYEWYLDGKVLSGKTGASLSLKNVSDSGVYHCKVIASVPSVPSAGEKSKETDSLEVDISTCLVTVTIDNAEKNLFDPDPEFTYKISGDPADKMSGKLSRKEGEDVGKYTIELGTLAFPKEVADNYEVLVTTGTLSILDIGELPLVSIANVSDQSYVVGKNDSKILVKGSDEAIPKDAIVSLSVPKEGVKEAMEKTYSAKILKAFAVDLASADGKALTLSKYAKIQLSIPLTEEEEIYKPESIRAVLQGTQDETLRPTTTQIDGVTYIVVEIDRLGTVALFEGQKVVTGQVETTEKPEKEEPKEGSPWMWVIIITLSLCAIGAMIFTFVQAKKSSAPTKTYRPSAPKPLTPEQQAEKARARRIADELNAMAPVPELDATNPHDSGLRTRPVSVPEAKTIPMKNVPAANKPRQGAPRQNTTARPAGQAPRQAAPRQGAPKPRKISFEDLED